MDFRLTCSIDIVKVKLEIIHISIANILQTVKDITQVNILKIEKVACGLSIDILAFDLDPF